MALIKIFADFLAASTRQGAEFDRTITFGRQENYLSLDPQLRESKSPVVADPFMDSFCRNVLGTQTLHALDYSSYQGADIVHDLNLPLPSTLHSCCDAVIDGGTLEHVFDFPAAIRNAMLLPKRGGSLFLFTPANNMFGHGFYQFSADLFYRVLCPANGFRIDKMAMAESYFIGVERGMRAKRYAVHDPALSGGRSDLVNGYPTMLFVHATKIGDVPERVTALQSDYAATWATPTANPSKTTPHNKPKLSFKSLVRAGLAMLPASFEQHLRSKYESMRFYGLGTHPCFPIAPSNYFDGTWAKTIEAPP